MSTETKPTFVVTVTEFTGTEPADGIERYRQTVDRIDLQAIIIAVNKAPRAPRIDKGQPRKTSAGEGSK